nr:uncharacterized protein LOC112034872 [Quercus suber]
MWFIEDHFLSLRPWEPFFKPSIVNVSLIAVWIKLNELPIELYETKVLKEISESIGKVLQIDSHTAMEARGRYARLCIRIDINRLLFNSILIGRFEQVVTYEGIQKLYFSCGRIGHKVEACPYTICKEKDKEQISPTKEALESQINDVDDGSADLQNLHGVVTHNAYEATDVEGHYGQWMMVSRKTYGQKGKRTDYSTGLGTRSAGNSAWNSTNQLSPVFAEGMSMPVGGPSSSKNLPRRLANPKIGTRFKNEVKSWASKTPRVFTIKERPTSSPSMAKLPVGSFKEAMVSLKQDNNPNPSPRVQPISPQ